MPSASASAGRAATRRSPANRASTRRSPARSAARPAPARVRWDRLGRVAMLGVLVVLACLYLSAGVRLLSTWREARGVSAKVAAMQREHNSLQRQHEALGGSGAVEAQARKLGMMKHGELPFIISGLPNN
jgi:cell division protein FtsB